MKDLRKAQQKTLAFLLRFLKGVGAGLNTNIGRKPHLYYATLPKERQGILSRDLLAIEGRT